MNTPEKRVEDKSGGKRLMCVIHETLGKHQVYDVLVDSVLVLVPVLQSCACSVQPDLRSISPIAN